MNNLFLITACIVVFVFFGIKFKQLNTQTPQATGIAKTHFAIFPGSIDLPETQICDVQVNYGICTFVELVCRGDYCFYVINIELDFARFDFWYVVDKLKCFDAN